MDTIKIGGQDYPVKLRYIDIPLFSSWYNQYFNEAALEFEKINGRLPLVDSDDQIIIGNDFFFKSIFQCLKENEKGKKPFKNIKEMIGEIEFDEMKLIVDFVGSRILKIDAEEDRKTKNLKQ